MNRQGMHGETQRSTAQHIDPSSLQFASTGSDECEPESALFDKAVHLVEELGDFLYFVNQYPILVARRNFCAEPRWIGQKLVVSGRIKEIENKRLREMRLQPS